MPEVLVTINGRELRTSQGTVVAAALAQAGTHASRHSSRGEPRAPLCGMGVCYECRVTIDGHPHRLGCQVACEDGMHVATMPTPHHTTGIGQALSAPTSPQRTPLHFDILIVGGGPAGMSTANAAAQHGARVGILDENQRPGGQIWRGHPQALPIDDRASKRGDGITFLGGARAIASLDSHTLLVETSDKALTVSGDHLIIAAGARERFLPFPGWTLPGVMGAGGLQALVKGGLPIAGKRVVIAGSGPLLLAVAAYLKQAGAHVRLIAEQTSWSNLLAFGRGLRHYPSKLVEAVSLGRHLAGTRLLAGCWVTQAVGGTQLEAVMLQRGADRWSVDCDYLACGWGLLPNTELAAALGCTLSDGTVAVNEWQATSIPGVYAAGEQTGIGGVDLSIIEGRIAGLIATGQDEAARRLLRERATARRFAASLEQHFALRPEVLNLALDPTIVCRCEDVTYGELRHYTSWRDAKLKSRCGMGACQGRICGAATALLFGWEQDSIRPPIAAARIASLSMLANTVDGDN